MLFALRKRSQQFVFYFSTRFAFVLRDCASVLRKKSQRLLFTLVLHVSVIRWYTT